ncbi:deoxynucleotidyltransferase terminal-interacting protein 2 [Anopheles nili]|uniref:deoxynucleotidyltransferase terminal-interacting protein 2 n=1 Tax=Anopheles nili TaxID=185578 RepID=UPI00237ABC08|nr:deoxynucleotidyltransferase terminal-interacting protein 2 [Anopheles nili]
MDLFFVDTTGDNFANSSIPAPVVKLPQAYLNTYEGIEPVQTPRCTEEENGSVEKDDALDDDDEDYDGLPPPGQSISQILNEDDNVDIQRVVLRPKDITAGGIPAKVQRKGTKDSSKRRKTAPNDELGRTDVEKELKSAILTPAIEKKEDIARLAKSDEAIRKLNRLERNKTKGKNWFDMPAPELTTELKNELQLMKMRSVLDPKLAFKRLEKRKLPKYFEIGKVMDSPVEHFNERGIKKLKSKSLVDELLADAEFQKFNKRKYAESLERQKKKAYHKAVMKMKREKKNKKKK